MTKIKDASIIFLIVFIIASILYGIHMFRYEFIYKEDQGIVIRYDRITNEQCYSVTGTYTGFSTIDAVDHIKDPTNSTKYLYPCRIPAYNE